MTHVLKRGQGFGPTGNLWLGGDRVGDTHYQHIPGERIQGRKHFRNPSLSAVVSSTQPWDCFTFFTKGERNLKNPEGKCHFSHLLQKAQRRRNGDSKRKEKRRRNKIKYRKNKEKVDFQMLVQEYIRVKQTKPSRPRAEQEQDTIEFLHLLSLLEFTATETPP